MMLTLADRLRKAILAIDGVMVGESIFDEGHEAFFVDSRQMAGIFADIAVPNHSIRLRIAT